MTACRRAARPSSRLGILAGIGALVGSTALGLAPVAHASATYTETTGGQTHSWSNYTNAGGTAGRVYPGQTSVGIDCVEQNGFRVSDGDANWYHIAGSSFYASAEAFYNNGATSGSLNGTPYVDPAVPTCESLAASSGVNETTGGQTHTWTNYNNAGGTEGPTISGQQTVQIRPND